jgi:hypothetical protein
MKVTTVLLLAGLSLATMAFSAELIAAKYD